MHFLLSVAAAASFLTPPLIRDAAILKVADYPVDAVRKGKEGAVLVGLFVDPKGRVIRCQAERIEGADFTSTVCAKMRRGGFHPAKDRQGNPVYGYTRNLNSFTMPEPGKRTSYPFQFVADYHLSMKPPTGVLTEPRTFPFAVDVDEGGNFVDCSSRDQQADAPLVEAACAQLKAQWKAVPLADEKGVPQSYIRSVSVEFVPEATTP